MASGTDRGRVGRSASSRPGRSTTNRPKKRQSAWRTDRLPLLVLLLAAFLGTTTLVGLVAFHYVDSDLRTSVTVNGIAISRADLRGRMALEAALTSARLAHVRTATAAGLVTSEQQATITAGIEAAGGDPVSSAIDALVDDTLITAAADRAGLHPTVDQDAELERFAAGDLDRELQWLTIVDPGRPAQMTPGIPAPAAEGTTANVRATQRTSAAAWAFAQLQQGTTFEATKATLTDAGWTVSSYDSWLVDSGPIPNVPDALLVAARDPGVRQGDGLGPFVDPIHATGSVGIVKQIGAPSDPAAPRIVGNGKVDGGAIRRWATALAAQRALAANLLAEWRTTPQLQARAAELVIGPSDVQGRKGEFVSFAHLVVDQLPADVESPAGPDRASRIATELAALSQDAREHRFSDLVGVANGTPSSDPLRRSSELGYFTRDELIPELARIAFAPGVVDGALLGPVQTTAGPELYLVRGKFTGTLDERSEAELVEARTVADLAMLASRISPVGDASRAVIGPWRAEAELDESGPAHEALLARPVGALSDPFVLDDQIVIVRVLERRTASLDPEAVGRLTARGWAAWLAKARGVAVVTIDPEPLPGLHGPTPPPTGSPTSAGLETPFVPDLPGSTSGQVIPGLPTFQLAP